jgi:hypothetical protein
MQPCQLACALLRNLGQTHLPRSEGSVMHAMFVTVDIKPGQVEDATEGVKSMVIPTVSKSPGFVKGIWFRSADETTGYGVVVFEDEASANESVAQVVAPEGAPITIRNVEVCPVTAEA